MTLNEFIVAIESYYDKKYTVDAEISIIRAFLKNNVADLEQFFGAVIAHHSKKWHSLPDIVVMREAQCSQSAPEIIAELWWQKLANRSNSIDVLITDPIAFFVVNGYGSWDRFCEARDGEYRELTHKDFISRYVTAMQSGVDVTPHTLFGYYGVEYGAKKERIRIIGDENRGRQLLAENITRPQIENLTSFIKAVE